MSKFFTHFVYMYKKKPSASTGTEYMMKSGLAVCVSKLEGQRLSTDQ